MLKTADPHVMESCPNCKTNFVIDLRWERPEEVNTYRALNDRGEKLDAAGAARSGQNLLLERSKELVECPKCHDVWYSTFLRKPQQSNAPKEIVHKFQPPSGMTPHRPQSYMEE